MRKIAVMGAGAIGGTLSGLFTKGGQDVTVIDPWMEHVRLIRERGLQIDGVREQHLVKVKAVHTGEVERLKGAAFDIVVICVKSHETEGAVRFMQPYMREDTWVVSAQNAINEETIAPMVGAGRTLGCVIMLSTWLVGAGHIRHFPVGAWPEMNYSVGELDGRTTERIQEVRQIFSLAGGAQVTTDLWGERWSKLAINCMSNATSGITGLGGFAIRQNPKSRQVLLKLAAESIRVGRTLGYRMASPFKGFTLDQVEQAAGPGLPELEAALTKGAPSAEEGKPSLAQDVVKGRKTEVDHLNGYIVRRGAAIGVPAPYNAAVCGVVHGVESGEFRVGMENIDRVIAIAQAHKG